MTTVSIITVALNNVDLGALALTPLEKWDAASSRFSTYFTSSHWFIPTSIAAIIILTALLVMVSLYRMKLQRRISNQSFIEYADRRGLSRHERWILLDIANKAGLKQSESIFTMAGAFDNGAAAVIKENLIKQHKPEESEQLKSELSYLREKLGFRKRVPVSIGPATKSRKLSSRQIPVGKKLQITRRKNRSFENIESTVIKNDDIELTLKLTTPLESIPGEFWRVRYYFGASVWEFDTSVVGCDGDILILNHSDDIRFINRRRFFRVPVSKTAFVSQFPFAKELAGVTYSTKDISNSGNSWRPLEFVPAIVTELAGPGLRLDVPLEVKVGDRVLVAFIPDEERDEQTPPLGQNNKKVISKIVQDIGEVRHTKATQNGSSIAVELTGLSDSNVNELIRITNLASRKAGSKFQKIPAYTGNGQNIKEGVLEPVTV